MKQLLKACGDQRPETITDSLKQAFRWRSSRWWYTTQTEGMRDDPMNHTNWKHKWKRHNRGNVWDKIASDWAGTEDWINKRKNKTSVADKTEFVTRKVNLNNLSTVHRKEKGKREENKQAQNRWDPLTPPFIHAKMAPQYNCGTTLRLLASG